MSLLDRLIVRCDDFMWKSGPSLSDVNDAINRVLEPEEQSTMSEHDTQLRLECLRLAVDIGQTLVASGVGETDTVARAARYFDFLVGASAKSPREAIDAALDAANVR